MCNPFRYRGYVYDGETGLYYLRSRYYNPARARFLNADGYIATGRGLLDSNMYACCGNNTVNRLDPNGYFWNNIWQFIQTATAETGNAMQSLSVAYASCGGAAVADGPLPIGDAVGLAGAAVLTIGAVGYGIYQATQTSLTSFEKTEENDKIIPLRPDNPVFFPVNPNSFNPVGLVKIPRVGTKNGALISWMDPVTNAEVFRWDENPNYSNGPHYHIYGAGHYYPGTIIPEPYATIYFPSR